MLFVHAPHYVLQFHFDAFLEGVDKTHHFNTNDWYPFVLDNSDAHANWLLAGMRKYNQLCNDVSDLANMNQFLKALSLRKSKDHSGCPAFQNLRELDYVACMSIIKRCSDMITPIVHLLPEEKERRNLLIRIITIVPSNLSSEYLPEFISSKCTLYSANPCRVWKGLCLIDLFLHDADQQPGKWKEFVGD